MGSGRTKGPYRKYRNQKTIVTVAGELVPHSPSKPATGILFDSLKEAKRYLVLLGMLRGGTIQWLRRQVTYKLVVNGLLIARYRADFVYIRDGNRVVEDVKSDMTRKLREYQMKKSLMKAIHGIDIEESI